MRRTFLTQAATLTAAAGAGAFAGRVAAQAAYPDRPVKVIVAFAPGGSVDPMMRIIQPKLNEYLGQPFVIENRPGGTTSIAAGAVTKSTPDGYTLLFTSANSHVIHTIGASHISYDPVKDFSPIACVSRAGWALAVHSSVPVKTVAEYIAYCKAHPGKLSYGSAGIGGANHLAMERLNLAAGIKTTHVPYKAVATAYLDLLAGRIQAYFTTTSLMQSGIDSGQLRVLAYTATHRDQVVPPGMTFTAVGMPELEDVDSINVLLGPPGMPAPIVARLSGAVERALGQADVRAAIAAQKQYAYYLSPQQLADRMRNDQTRYARIMKEANIKLGN